MAQVQQANAKSTTVEDIEVTPKSSDTCELDVKNALEAGVTKHGQKSVKAHQKSGKAPPLFMYLMAGCAALNSTNIGFDIGVSSGVALLLQEQWQLTDGQIGLFMSSIQFMGALGGLCSQGISDRLGRRWTFATTQVVLLVGLTIQALSGSFVQLMVGRVVVGLAIGFGFAVDPLYIAELAPAEHRGRLTSWPEIAINFGILLGFFVNWAFADITHNISWRLMLIMGGILPTILLVLSLRVMPESPRWCMRKGFVDKATEILRSSHPPNEDIASIVEVIKLEVSENQSKGRSGWAPVLCPDKMTRRLLLIGIGVALAQQICGVDSVVAYSPTIFKRAHVATSEGSLFAVTMLVGVVKVVFIVSAAHYIDTKGRRPLLIWSTSLVSICLMAIAMTITLNVGWLSVVAVCAYVATYSMGIGPITWLMVAEVFPSDIRAKAMSLATFINRGTCGIVTLTFLPLSNALGGQAQYFLLFAALTGLVAVFACTVVPETKQKSLEELHASLGSIGKVQASYISSA